MALLEYQNALKATNMFFLQTLDINSEHCLDEVQKVNGGHVLALISLSAKIQHDRALISKNDGIHALFGQIGMFSIGSNPT